MIDVEIDVFDRISRAIYADYPNAYVSSKYVPAPPMFPAVSIIEKTNLPYQGAMDSSDREKASTISYVVDIYSNSEKNGKKECKNIMRIVSDEMCRMNMVRNQCTTPDNIADPSIYRMNARFQAVVDEEHVLYRR